MENPAAIVRAPPRAPPTCLEILKAAVRLFWVVVLDVLANLREIQYLFVALPVTFDEVMMRIGYLITAFSPLLVLIIMVEVHVNWTMDQRPLNLLLQTALNAIATSSILFNLGRILAAYMVHGLDAQVLFIFVVLMLAVALQLEGFFLRFSRWLRGMHRE